MVDFIGRYEQLEIDWQKICYLVRLPDLKLTKINTSANLEQAKGRTTFNKGDYRRHYNKTTYQIVNKIYKSLGFSISESSIQFHWLNNNLQND